jgi:DNA-binding NarL/FixJ family response regulator
VIPRITLVLLDDHALAPPGVDALIRSRSGLEILAVPAETEEAFRQVRDTSRHSPVIVMGLDPNHGDVVGFVRAGVSGFVMANATRERILSTIRAVMQGRSVLPAELTATLFAQLNGQRMRNAQPFERLAAPPAPATLAP